MWDGGGVVVVNGFFLAALHGCLGASKVVFRSETGLSGPP